MRLWIISTALSFLFCATIAIASSPLESTANGNPETILDRSSAELAATLAIAKLEASMADSTPDDSLLFNAMSASPGDFRSLALSRQALRKCFSDSLAHNFASGASQILQRLAGANPVSEIFSPSFLDSATNPAPAFIESMTARCYDGLFNSARSRICNQQAARISSSIRPDVAEVDSRQRGELAALLVERIAHAQTEPVFEENLKFIESSIVDPMIDDAFAQRAFQEDMAKTCAPAGFAPSAIAADIVRRTEASIEARRAAATSPDAIYGLFPSVTNTVAPQCAIIRATAILDGFIENATVPLDADAIADAICNDISHHRTLANSHAAFLPDLAKKTAVAAYNAAIAAAPVAEQSELAAFAQSHFTSKSAEAAIEKKVGKVLDAQLATLRNSFAASQFPSLFPDIATNAWIPAAALVDTVAQSRNRKKTLDAWRDIEELARFADVESATPMLEETSRLLDSGIADRFHHGINAYDCQSKIVDSTYPAVVEEFSNQDADVESIIAFFSAEVLAQWPVAANEILATSEVSAYATLFPSIGKKIELLAHAIMDARKERTQDTTSQSIDDSPAIPDNPEEVPMTATVVFSKDRNSISAVVTIDGLSAGKFACPFSQKGFRRNSAAFSEAIVRTIGDRLRQAATSKRIALTVSFEVRDPFIYYGAVAEPAGLLKRLAAELASSIASFSFVQQGF